MVWYAMLCYPMLWYGIDRMVCYESSMLCYEISMLCYAMVYVVKDKHSATVQCTHPGLKNSAIFFSAQCNFTSVYPSGDQQISKHIGSLSKLAVTFPTGELFENKSIATEDKGSLAKRTDDVVTPLIYEPLIISASFFICMLHI